MTLSVLESVISIDIEKRRQLLYEVSPFGQSLYFIQILMLQRDPSWRQSLRGRDLR